MLTGRRFKLIKPTMALGVIDGKRRAVTIPDGGIIKVISGPIDVNEMVDVLWEERIVAMFAVDLQARCDEITSKSAKA